jgi:hypothetical protein
MKELVFMWFTGQDYAQCSSDEDVFIDKFCTIIAKQQKIKKISVTCHAPPLSDGKDGHPKQRKWATYVNEIDSIEVTTDKTCNVLDVEKELGVTAKHLYDLVKDEKLYLFGGTSNGCIPAYEFARHYSNKKQNVLGCILHNGCPAMENTEFGTRRKFYLFPTLMILGKMDHYWDYHRNSYNAAYVLGAAILPFNGRHGEMPSADASAKSFLAALMTHNDNKDKEEPSTSVKRKQPKDKTSTGESRKKKKKVKHPRMSLLKQGEWSER